jgi:chemotaxis methyl-accepting protein methylase
VNDPLKRVAELVERESGIQVREPQVAALAAALDRASQGMEAERFLGALDDPAQHSLLVGRLIDQVAIQETFFMREPRELEAIDWHQHLAAAHARGAGEVNVWVCACASGEEAYSVAMLASEAFGFARPPVAILATDISMGALRRAEAAVYSERSTRELSPARRERFMVPRGAGSAVGEQLRSLVRLRRHNLVADPVPPAGEVPFDLVLCRNVLIYFGADTVETVVGSLESAVQPGGQLILGASDRLSSTARRLTEFAAAGASGTELRAPPIPARERGERSPAFRRPLGRAKPARDPAAAAPPFPEAEMSAALRAADGGDYAAAIGSAERVLATEPLSAEAYYVLGISELASDDPAAAVASLRRALYVDPSFVLAAFQLARAHDLCGDRPAARRAYARTLRALGRGDDRPRGLPAQVDAAEIAAACRARLAE